MCLYITKSVYISSLLHKSASLPRDKPQSFCLFDLTSCLSSTFLAAPVTKNTCCRVSQHQYTPSPIDNYCTVMSNMRYCHILSSESPKKLLCIILHTVAVRENVACICTCSMDPWRSSAVFSMSFYSCVY